MKNEIEKAMSFEDRMKQRIKESIGDMITDEELSKIVQKGIHVAFFESKILTDSYGREIKPDDPLIVDIVKSCVSQKVNIAVKEWFAENPEKVTLIVDKVIRDGIFKIIIQEIESNFRNAFNSFGQEIQNNITNMISNR